MAEWIDLLDPDEGALKRALPSQIHARALEQLLDPAVHDDEPRPRLEGHDHYLFGVFLLPVAVREEDRVYYQEIDIVDLLCTIIYESPVDMPVNYFVDIARQTWDESRHTMMGIRRLRELGYDLRDCGCPTGRYAAWRRMSVLERIAFLTQVGEACSLAGKREHIQRWLSEGDLTSSALVEFDISDESQRWICSRLPARLHASPTCVRKAIRSSTLIRRQAA